MTLDEMKGFDYYRQQELRREARLQEKHQRLVKHWQDRLTSRQNGPGGDKTASEAPEADER